jgi:hypothetical protein
MRRGSFCHFAGVRDGRRMANRPAESVDGATEAFRGAFLCTTHESGTIGDLLGIHQNDGSDSPGQSTERAWQYPKRPYDNRSKAGDCDPAAS